MRRRRRSLHRTYADLLEKRHQGRLDRVYPELVHHFSEGDVPAKAVEYSLKLAKKSLDAFSPEEAARVAKTALDYLGDEEWEGDKALEGDARLLLAQASRMSGHTDAALREAEAAGKIFEREKLPSRVIEVILFAADTAWNGRKVDEARRLVERGIESAAAAQDTVHLPKLLSLAATVANLRGDYARAAAYGAQLDRLSGGETRRTDVIASGGRLVVAMSSPVAATEPATSRLVEETEVLSTAFESLLATDADGALVPALAEEWSLADGGRSARLRLRRGACFSDGTPVTAAAAKASLERAIRLRPDGIPAALAAVRGAEEHRKGESPRGSRNPGRGRRPAGVRFRRAASGISRAAHRHDHRHRAGRARRRRRRDRDRHGPLRRGAPLGRPDHPRAEPALRKGAGAAGVRRVPDGDERLGDHLGRPLGRDRAGPGPFAAGPRGDPPGAALSSGPRRDAEERDLLRALQFEEPPRRERRPPARARRRHPQPGLRLGRSRKVRRPRDRHPAARDPRARRRPAPPAPAPGGGARPPFEGRPRGADPAHRGRPPDPAGPAPGAHGRALRDLEGARRRDLDRDDRHEVVPRGAGEGGGGPSRLALDGRLRGPGRLHVQPLQLGRRVLPLLLLLRGDRPARRRSADGEPPGDPRRPLPEVRGDPPRRAGPDPALPRGRLPDRRPGRARPRAPEQRSVHQLRRDREVGGALGPRRARVGRRRRPGAGRWLAARHRSRFDGHPGAGRDDPPRLRDADAGYRRRARRPVARLGGDSRGRRGPLPVPPKAGRAVPRRPCALRPRRPLLVRAAAPAGVDRQPVPPRADPGRPEPPRRQGLGSRGIPHRLPLGVRHRAGKAAGVLPRPRIVAGSRHRAGGDRSRLGRAGGRGPSVRGPTASRDSSRGRGWSSRGIPPTGARATRRTRESSSGSASPRRRSARNSSPAGSPSRRISFPRMPNRCARTRASGRRIARARAS